MPIFYSHHMTHVRSHEKSYHWCTPPPKSVYFFWVSSTPQLQQINYHRNWGPLGWKSWDQIQRIREVNWSCLYRNIFSDIKKNSVALFMVELLTRCLKQPETQPDLFHFTEDAFLHMDEGSERVTANFPLYFALHLAVLLGFRVWKWRQRPAGAL
mgnify:CR=1 FL=1